ncbi:hypothetical protein [Xanthomonas arboricola]|uniref:hypothetical protein n=1 Tax=Xanthomonas arboricola TaxID=56448 RepID=UPI001430A70D|nr:hypothetical protein [Xanthomonas arboricola]NJB80281.1 hypothetical protein [Xanthomonas arboricola]
MYAVKGRSYRGINPGAQLLPGEVLHDTLPSDLLIPTSSERNEEIRMGIGRWIDDVARGNGYDNAVSCASYVSSGMQKNKAEALALVAWRDAVWAAAYALLAAPPVGVTTLAQVITLLPKPAAFGWVADPIELIQLPPVNPSA